MIGDLFYRVGQAIGELEARVGGPMGGLMGGLTGASSQADPAYDDEDADPIPDDASVATAAVLSAAGTWLASRLLRPKPVRWTRVVVAGVGAALLADLVGRMETPERDDDETPHAGDPAELLGRLSAGIAVAAGYASILYPRLPGSPLTRGLAFGALEIAAAPRGGLARIAAETPGLRFPLQALALPVDEHASPAAHLAFGLALGLLYRDGAGDEEEAYDDSDHEDRDDEGFED